MYSLFVNSLNRPLTCLQFCCICPTTRNAALFLQISYVILEETAVCHYRWIDSLDDIIELLSCRTWKTFYVSENFCHSSCFWKAKFICNLEWHWTHEAAWNLSCSEYLIKLQFKILSIDLVFRTTFKANDFQIFYLCTLIFNGWQKLYVFIYLFFWVHQVTKNPPCFLYLLKKSRNQQKWKYMHIFLCININM